MTKSTWIFIVIVLIVLAFFSFIIAGIISLFIGNGTDVTKFGGGNVALIQIKGKILTEKEPFLFTEESTVSTDTIKLIEKAEKNPTILAIIFEINSPGGSAVASQEIADSIKAIKKPTVAWIRELGASGAYWIASSADYIVANKMSITGSIGVISSYLEFSGLLRDYNVTYRRLVSGKYKDIGTPFKELTKQEERLFQERLDLIREYFIDEVSKNRKMAKKDVEEIATGLFYLGSQAKDLGLVDELGGKEEVKKYLERQLNMPIRFVKYEKKRSFFESLGEVINKRFFYVGKGIGNSLFEGNKQLRIIT
jgi:protease-4